MTQTVTRCPEQIRVLHVVRDLEPESGGPSRSVPQLAAALQQHNCCSAVMYLDRGRPTTNLPTSLATVPIRSHGFLRWITCPENKSPLEQQLPNLSRYYDVVHLHGTWDRLVHTVAVQSRKQNVPYVWAPRGTLEPWSLKQKYWKKKLAWWLYLRRDFQHAQRLHATSELEARNLQNLGLKPKIFSAANGIVFPAVMPERREEKSTRTALFLSRIHPKKGLELLINAWNQIRPAGWRCEIFGPSDENYLASLQKLIASHGLSDQIHIFPEADDQTKWKLYRTADLFVLPTYSENFGIVVAEALAMGTPVITTTGTPWHELPNRKCGWYVLPTVEGIADALRDAVQMSDDDRLEMGENGMEWMRSEFDWQSIAKVVRDEYQEIISS